MYLATRKLTDWWAQFTCAAFPHYLSTNATTTARYSEYSIVAPRPLSRPGRWMFYGFCSFLAVSPSPSPSVMCVFSRDVCRFRRRCFDNENMNYFAVFNLDSFYLFCGGVWASGDKATATSHRHWWANKLRHAAANWIWGFLLCFSCPFSTFIKWYGIVIFH